MSKKERDSKFNSLRNTLPSRFRQPLYRQSSSADVLPLPPPRDISFDGNENDKSGSNLGESSDLGASSPKSVYIRRTSSFQGSRESSDRMRDEPRKEDIIIFSSTPPVSIARTPSGKSPRAASFHKGSPDQAPVLQWPRGTTSAANRSQEHFLRNHRPISASSDTSLKDLQAQMATTPPPVNSRPSLERQFSRPGASHTSTFTSTSTVIESHHMHTISSYVYTKDTSESFAGSSASAGFHGVSVETRVTGSVQVSTSRSRSSSMDEDSDSKASKTTPADSARSLESPAVKQMAAGTQMLKVSAKKQHSRIFKLDLENFRILWESKKFGRSKPAGTLLKWVALIQYDFCFCITHHPYCMFSII